MKKCAVFLCALVLGAIGTAVYFSPLSGAENLFVYENNSASARADGVCYPASAVVRCDLDGDETAMYSRLDAIGAVVVGRAETGDTVIVYAYCPRVCAPCLSLSDGAEYNVMAACRAGRIAIGAPVLQGWY